MSYHKALHRFALALAACTFCLVIAGGLVTSTGSSLAVPDWPLSYGMVMPPMVGGILYEHGHRLIASLVGLLTVVLTIWIWKKEGRRWVKGFGIAALAAVIAQGLLGGLTVVLLLPTPISVAHAALGQTFFTIITLIALCTSRWWLESETPAAPVDTGLFRLSIITTCAVYLQLLFGAWMRHSGSGLAVHDFPFAYGQVFPSLSPENVARYNQQLIDANLRLFADGPVTSAQILIHMIHRIWAVAVLILIALFAVRLWRASGLPARVRRLGVLMAVLVVTQIALGALTVWSNKDVFITTAHVACGALILVTSAQILFHLARCYAVRIRGFSFVYSAERALA